MSRIARLGTRTALVAVIVLCLATVFGGLERSWSSARFTATATSSHNAVSAACNGSAFPRLVAAENPISWLRLGERGPLVDQAGVAWQQSGSILHNRTGALFCDDDGAVKLGQATLTSPAALPEKFTATIWVKAERGESGLVWSVGESGVAISMAVLPGGRVVVTYPGAAAGVSLSGGAVADGLWHMVSVTVTPTSTTLRVDLEAVAVGEAPVLGQAPSWTLGATSGGFSGHIDEFIVTRSILNQDFLAAVDSSV